jgi:beta-lactamase regulating signal transducer with metallopeptidase domain
MLNQIADTLFLRALDSLVIGALIATFAASLLRMRRQSSSARFAVWFSALIAIAVLPWANAEVWPRFGTSAPNAAAFTVPNSWPVYFLIAWAAIATVGLVRVGAGLIHLHALRRTFTKVDSQRLDEVTRATLQRYRENRNVELCTSGRLSVPTAVGLIQPAVVIPAWLMDELSPAQLNQILLHELAHLRRWDDWTNLAQKIVKALFFFHPAVWWIEKKISLEREMACDDVVLAESDRPRAYAECLLHLAEKSFIRRGVALAQAAVGRLRQTTLRVAQILDVNRPQASKSGWKSAVSLVAGVAVLSVVGISRAPRLVAFQDARPSTVASSSHGVTGATNDDLKKVYGQVRIVPAKFVPQPTRVTTTVTKSRKSVLRPRSVSSVRRQLVAPDIAQFVRMTDFQVSLTAGAPMFFVVEQDAYQTIGQTMFRVSIWHIVLVQPVPQSGGGIPRKET